MLRLQGVGVKVCIKPNAFGNALGSSLTAQSNTPAGSSQGMTEEEYWNTPAKTTADRYADTYGGEAINTSNPRDRLKLSDLPVGSDDLDQYTPAGKMRALARESNSLVLDLASQEGASLAPTVANAAKLGLFDVSGEGMPIKYSAPSAGFSSLSIETDNQGLLLAGRFANGLVHGAIDMIWQPVANTLDLGQAAVGLASGGSYEPIWLSGIGKNYQGGMSYEETVTRAALGSNPVTGVGMASYDMTGSALNGDWGGVAEGVGGLAGGFVAGKAGQRLAAPQIGSELGVIRIRSSQDVLSSNPGLPDLPGREAINFKGMPSAVEIRNSPLYRMFDTLDPNVRGAQPNGGYWSDSIYGSEAAWRGGAAVQKSWNAGTYQGKWIPENQSAWSGRAAPQAIEGFSSEKWGFKFGWINKGGDHQLYVPNSRGVIQPSTVVTQPSPWRKR